MWAEARKQEKKIRGIMVDFKKRADRRREFYEKIRRDPSSFLQIHGQQLKILLDANISEAASSSLMPWRGDSNNLIDRFDVRAHLDCIPSFEEANNDTETSYSSNIQELERNINYERWRNLIQCEFLGISEAKYLHGIWLEGNPALVLNFLFNLNHFHFRTIWYEQSKSCSRSSSAAQCKS